ncbi:MAG: AEC family transporter [Leptothrix sp. (in: b-proteobacteria)]
MTWDLTYKLAALFAMIALGWGAARGRLLGGVEAQRGLAGAAYNLFLPALLFRTTAALDVRTLPAPLLLAFFGPLLLWALAAWGWFQHQARRAQPAPGGGSAGHAAQAQPLSHPADPAVRTVSLSFGNSVQVGLPFAAALFGEAGLQLHLAIVSLHALVLLSLITVLAEVDIARASAQVSERQGLGSMLLTIARQTLIHPVVLPVVAGLAWHLTGLTLHPVADSMLVTLGQAGVPLCLILIGTSLAQYGLGASWARLLGLAALKLLLLPALVGAVGLWGFGLSGLPLAVLVMAAALPTGSNALMFAQRYGTLEGEASAVIVLSTLGFALTAPLWLSLISWVSAAGA